MLILNVVLVLVVWLNVAAEGRSLKRRENADVADVGTTLVFPHQGQGHGHGHHRNHRHRTNDTGQLVVHSANGNDTYRIKKFRKRCRYSEHEIDELNEKNLKKQSSSSYYYANNNNNNNKINNGDVNGPNTQESNEKYLLSSQHRQPRVRDQFNSRFGELHFGAFQNEHGHTEKEILYVNVGEKVNLTCNIHTKEIDWHFKDKNQTTTILSFGLQLQVAQPLLYELNNDNDLYDHQAGDLAGTETPDFFYSIQRSPKAARSKLLKYQLSSDRQSNHVLSLYVQGAQDEGSYQCVDSKSDVPVKKTILVYLKNNSRALTSAGYNQNKFAYLMSFYAITFTLTFLNTR